MIYAIEKPLGFLGYFRKPKKPDTDTETDTDTVTDTETETGIGTEKDINLSL